MFPWNLFPFHKDMKNIKAQMNPEEVDKYVTDIMNQVFPQQMQKMQGMMNPQSFMSDFNYDTPETPNDSSLSSSVFETHNNVFVRLPIKEEQWLKDMRIYHTSNQLIIEHIPEKEDKHSIVLPAIVKKKGASAYYKDGMLEIKIQKNIDMQYSQIDVSEIL
ncbi:Hsp20/alpha crystallin family protein [Cytobacillus dafuensis]|uniref:Hsp20/alpha crystallin family protein n=1 Tax=Cytobacillus dafuensis TaxID=1742359 RepID=A0A5B8Z5W7_CYTDA|nr:Hsp20/alpha crystallin family protein [Cytobacillus dafuensis]QED48277.1 Hsp20/alpha crystallin family protein [Cytobacillus dafuensis]